MPWFLPLLAAGVSAASTISASGAQADAEEKKAFRDKQMWEFNSKLSRINARDAVSRGRKDAFRIGREGRKISGAQRAALAGGNVEVDSGSALAIQEESHALAVEDMMTIENNAWREAWGYQVQAVGQSMQGQMAFDAGNAMASAYRTKGALESTATILGGVASAADKYKPYKKAG